MIIFAAVLSIAFLLLSIKRPSWAYGLVLALLPAYVIRFPILNIPTTALEVMVGVFLLGAAVGSFNQAAWNRITTLKRINVWVGFFVLAAVISTIYSPEPTRALGQLKAFILEPVLMFYAAIVIFKSKEDVRSALKVLLFAASAISAFGLVQYSTHLFLPLRFWGNGEEMKRITSIFEYPNAFALYVAPLFVFFFALFSRGYNLGKKHWVAAGLIAMAIAIVLTYSRGAWLGILAGIAILSLKQTGITVRHWKILTAVALVVISPILLSRFKTTFNDGSSSERVALYTTAVNKILDEPLLGNGLYGFRTTLQNSDYTGEILNYPHNIILNFWLETGLLGIVSFALLLFFSFRESHNRPNVVKFAAALFLVVMIIHGMVDAPYFKNDLSILFWFVLSLFYIEE